MNTQIAFTTDKRVKDKFMKRVKKDGMTLKGVLNQFMQAYANEQFGMSLVEKKRQLPEEKMTEREKRAYVQAMKDLKEGKNIYSMQDLEELMRKR